MLRRALSEIKNHIQSGRDFLLDLIFPRSCLNCGQESCWACPDCLGKIEIRKAFACPDCDKPNTDSSFCANCQAQHSLNGLWISSSYQEPLISKLIKQLKYHYSREVAQVLSGILLGYLKENQIKHKLIAPASHLLIPVPLHQKRKRSRGFNQSELISDILSSRLSLKTITDRLQRIKNTKPQAKFGRAERLSNVRDAFVWIGADLDGENIILVDDVASTGATLDNCAQVLKAHGAGKIWGLVLARN
jgi:ComF family protein